MIDERVLEMMFIDPSETVEEALQENALAVTRRTIELWPELSNQQRKDLLAGKAVYYRPPEATRRGRHPNPKYDEAALRILGGQSYPDVYPDTIDGYSHKLHRNREKNVKQAVRSRIDFVHARTLKLARSGRAPQKAADLALSTRFDCYDSKSDLGISACKNLANWVKGERKTLVKKNS